MATSAQGYQESNQYRRQYLDQDNQDQGTEIEHSYQGNNPSDGLKHRFYDAIQRPAQWVVWIHKVRKNNLDDHQQNDEL